jgi:hypothetical protein
MSLFDDNELDGVSPTMMDTDDFEDSMNNDDVTIQTMDPSSSSSHEEEVVNSRAVDDLLSEDLMNLSPGDRISISEELHGVSCMADGGEDNAGAVAKALRELDQTIEHKIPSGRKKAFLKASRLRDTFVHDVGFRMKFLRCKLFDAEQAAWLLVRYLNLVEELFGEKCLSRPIRLEDVQSTKEERTAFRSGFIQLLPFGDRAGRRIVMITTDALNYSTFLRVKIFLYIWLVASNDVATQQKGAVLICWDGRKNMPLPRPREQLLVRRLFSAIPLRICAIHFCFPDSPFYRMARAIFTLTVGATEHRNRLRFHIGEETELKYQVGTFGVPVSQIPLTETGNVKTTSFYKWIAMRKLVEDQESADRRQQQSQQAALQLQSIPRAEPVYWDLLVQTQKQYLTTDYVFRNNTHKHNNHSTNNKTVFVEYPGLNDVAFRKGMSLMHHPGNDFFHGLIQSKIFEHDRASQTGKARMAWWVMDEVRKRNGRFLSWHQQGWWALLEDESKIRSRVAVFFREWKKHLKAQQNLQTIKTSSKLAFQFQQPATPRGKSCSTVSSDESDAESKL